MLKTSAFDFAGARDLRSLWSTVNFLLLVVLPASYDFHHILVWPIEKAVLLSWTGRFEINYQTTAPCAHCVEIMCARPVVPCCFHSEILVVSFINVDDVQVTWVAITVSYWLLSSVGGNLWSFSRTTIVFIVYCWACSVWLSFNAFEELLCAVSCEYDANILVSTSDNTTDENRLLGWAWSRLCSVGFCLLLLSANT